MFLENGEKTLSMYIDNPENYFPTHKGFYNVQVYKPEIGTKVYNEFEDAVYTTSEKKPFVMVGTEGEEWVIDSKKLSNTYRLEGEPLSEEFMDNLGVEPQTIYTPNPELEPVNQNFAMRIPADISFSLKTSWGEELVVNSDISSHGAGDFIVCPAKEDGTPDLSDRWVVNGQIFESTYDMGEAKEVEIGVDNILNDKSNDDLDL